MNAPEISTGKRAAHREDVRRRIEEALLECMAAGQMNRINHDALAEMTGVSRRTVYRYFPDRDALMKALWHRTTRAAGPAVGFPRNAEEILARLDPVYRGFDRNA